MLGVPTCRTTAYSFTLRSYSRLPGSCIPLKNGISFPTRHYTTPTKPANSAASSNSKPGFLSRLIPSGPSSTASSFRKIVALAKPERKPLTTAVGLLLMSSAVTMSIPFTIGKLIDFFSSANPQIPLGLSTWQASGALLFLFSAGAAANAGRTYLMRMSGQRIVARLREQTYSAALRQEVEFVERGEGDVLSRLSVDTTIVGESVTQNLSDGLRAVVMSFAGLGAMFYLSPTLTTLMLCVVPPVSFGVVFYGRYLKRLSNRTQEAMGEMSKHATESLSALRTVQAYNAQSQEQQKFHERVVHVLNLARKEAVASGIFFGSTGWSGNVTILALLGYGGSLVSQGEITVGDLTSLLLYTVYVGSGLQMLTCGEPFSSSSIMRGIGAGNRVFELLGREPAIPTDTGAILDPSRRGPVRFERVGFEYPSRKGVEILKDFNLEIGVGESVAIVGTSGSGKSSIQSLLLRYYDPVQGKVTFDGQDIRELRVDSWRNAIGIVPQDPVLFTGTIASNIAFGNPTATREQIESAAREANCEFVWGMPKGFDTEIGRLSLSGGQRQRLAIARALLKNPAILALDEATSALDANSENRVNDAVDKILRKRQTTCLFVAHRLSTIARAERIVVLEGGRITESGTYRQLVTDPASRFRALMAEQLHAASTQHASPPSSASSPPSSRGSASETETEIVMEKEKDQGEEAEADEDAANAAAKEKEKEVLKNSSS
ncbi:P-loop containing nucleoside triphosphate hydrolase protein [Lentinula raphanica]|nr:P-loop containing nucleoside triphosphate hydrolase protein [Lentinula raphanica]